MEPVKRRRVFIWAAGALGAVFVLLLGLFLFLQTGTGKDLLTSRLSRLLSSEPEQQVILEHLEGFVPFRMQLGRLEVRDAAGTWLHAENVALSWSPLALLGGKFHIEALTAARIEIQRLPPSAPQEPPKPPEAPQPFTLPEKLPPVSLDHLKVEELVLGQPVVGKAGAFQFEGKLGAAQDAEGLTAAFHLRRIDAGPETRLDLDATLVGKPSRLVVDGKFHEAPNGWLAAVLNLQEAGELQVDLGGEGPLSDWKGFLRGNLGKYGSIDTQIQLGVREETVLGLDGKSVAAASLLPPELVPLLGLESRFGLTLRLTPGKSLALEKVDLQGAGYHLLGSGGLNLQSQELSSDFTLAVQDLKVLESLAGTPIAGGLSLQGKVGGILPHPQGQLTVDLQKLLVQKLQVEHVKTDLHFEPLDRQAAGFSGVRLTGSGQAEKLNLLQEKKLPETSLGWSLDVSVPPQGKIAIRRFEIQGNQHLLNAVGDFDPAALEGWVDVNLEVKDLRLITAFLGAEHPGAVKLDVRLKGEGSRGPATARLEGEAVGLGGLPPAVMGLMGPRVTLVSHAALHENRKLQISGFELAGQGFRLTSDATADLTQKVVDGSWKLVLPRLDSVGAAMKKPLSGSLEAEGHVKGPFQALALDVSVKGQNIQWEKSRFDAVASELRAREVPGAPRGDFSLDARAGRENLKTALEFALEKDILQVANLRLDAPGSKLEGTLGVDLSKTLLQGNVNGRFSDLKALGRFLGQPLAGTGEIKVLLSHARGQQDVKALLQGKDLVLPFGRTGQVGVDADLKNVLQAPSGSAKVEIQDFQQADLILKSLQLQAAGDEKGAKFQGRARGRSREDFNLETVGEWARSGSADRIQVKSLTGNFGKYPVELLQPLGFTRSGQELSLEKLALKFGKARVDAAGNMGPRRVSLDARLEEFPLGMLALAGVDDLSGTGNGRLQMTGDPGRPSTRLNLRLVDVRSGKASMKNVPPANLALNSSLEAGVLKVDAALQGPVEGTATAGLSVPVRFSVVPFAFDLPPSSPLQGNLQAEADLAKVMEFVPQEGQKLSGHFNTHLEMGGTVSEPVLSGDAVIEKGHYQNLQSGTVLDALSARVLAKGRRLDIESLKATDGGAGSISATGGIDLLPEKDFPFHLDLTLKDATLVRREDVTGTLRGGLNLEGSSRGMALGGKLEVAPAQVSLPKSLPPGVTRLEVIEINGPVKEGKQAKPAAASSPFKMDLDLGVTLPNRVFVRGRGLESEWSGKLRIEGSSDAPVVTGNLDVIRGYFEFLDKRFKFVKGNLQFNGAVPPAPVLDVTAEAQARDITARLVVTGLASSPKIELESDPYLPRDEILARILFGRNLSSITPVQALRLAKAVRALSSGGSGLDLIGSSRRFLGLDQLDFREGEGSETAVGVGKYLTEDIYVDVQKNVSGQAGRARVEVELTPNITITGEAGSDATTGLGVNWKRDY
ncbi:translocation/assembly module TamB domain-containing protein [Desulforhabdus sp. TSK]|uniref:translocation/assembly module TamB domain-containing protein n=1 Tax=Desulforhabdus sp. TSK TaxID=2925014 RepID=UPI001FC7FB79|nr:translocation/assembly module TamB domain-containing protein [Desulforhabdus sp. TSK]GKT10037.1 translocation/assembly module TamB [Desulforhabdus sp. TSK]